MQEMWKGSLFKLFNKKNVGKFIVTTICILKILFVNKIEPNSDPCGTPKLILSISAL